jgi:hypothetical protein
VGEAGGGFGVAATRSVRVVASWLRGEGAEAGVVGAEQAFAQGGDLVEVVAGALDVAGAAALVVGDAEVEQGLGGVELVAVGAAAREHVLEVGQGVGDPAGGDQDQGEVAVGLQGLGVVGAEGGGADGQAALQRGFGQILLTLLVVDGAKRAEVVGHVRSARGRTGRSRMARRSARRRRPRRP